MIRSAGWLLVLALAIGSLGCSGDDDASDDRMNGDPNDPSDGDGDGDGDGEAGDGDGAGGSGDGSGGSGDGTGDGGTGMNADGGSAIIDGGVPGVVADPMNPTGIVDGGWLIPDELLLCNGEACACADGVDNDADGTADGFDIECTGPADDDEGSFSTGISGDNRDPYWQDCFFDGNSGGGDDHCRYHTECLTGEREQTSSSCSLSEECITFCAARTPNGCDCFGCCTITDDNGDEFNFIISDTCDADNLEACASCTPTDMCGNECGECELCPGKSIEELPDHCFPPPPGGGSGGSSGSGSGGTGGSGSGGTGGSGEDPCNDNNPDTLCGDSGSGGSGGSGGTGGTPYTCENGEPLCYSQASCPPGFYCFYACCTPIQVE